MGINVQMTKIMQGNREWIMQGSNDIELYISNGMLGFEHEGYFIIEPRSSVCGRFEVDPYEEYGLNEEQVAQIENFNKIHDLS